MEAGCILATKTEDALYIVDARDRLHRYNTFEESPGVMTKQATWQLPSEMEVVDALVEAELLDETHLLLVSENYAGVVFSMRQRLGSILSAKMITKQCKCSSMLNRKQDSPLSMLAILNVADVTMDKARKENNSSSLGQMMVMCLLGRIHHLRVTSLKLNLQ